MSWSQPQCGYRRTESDSSRAPTAGRARLRFEIGHRGGSGILTALLVSLWMLTGCGSAHWLKNGFLDPTQVGAFDGTQRNEIQHSLSILEEPAGIQNAEEPTASDLVPEYEELPIVPGDIVNIAVHELQAEGITTERQARIGNSGFVTLPLIGPVRVAGLTPRELEIELGQRLRESEILDEADVQVSVIESEASQYSIVGSVTRPGVYPLSGPEYRLLSAIAAAGDIPNTIETLYIFRRWGQDRSGPAFAARGRRGRSGHRAKADVPYTMSDVSRGTARANQGEPVATHPATGDTGLNVLDFLDRESPEEASPVDPDWDADLGQWVIRQPHTQPATGEAPAVEDRPALHGEVPTSGTVDDESALSPTPRAQEPWGADESLQPPLRIIEIPVKELKDGDPRYNIVIRPYDLINVPPGVVGEFFLMGNVARPGAYSLTGRRLTVKEAIASAGGFGELAWPARADLVRRVGADEEQIIQLDLDAIFAGEAPDFYVKPSDIINVGTTPAATFFAVIRNAFRFTYGMGFVYDRNFADSDTFTAREQVKARRQQEAQQRGIPF